MNDYTQLINSINQTIKKNGNKEITGDILNAILKLIADYSKNNFENIRDVIQNIADDENIGIIGSISPNDILNNLPDGFYLPTTAGTYTNMGGLVVKEGYFTIISKIGTTYKIASEVKMPEPDLTPIENRITENENKINNQFNSINSFFKSKESRINYFVDLTGVENEDYLENTNPFYIEYYEVTNILNLKISTKGWIGSDQVSLIFAYNNKGEFISNIISASSIVGQTITDLLVEFPQGTQFLKITNRVNNKVNVVFNTKGNIFNKTENIYKDFKYTNGIKIINNLIETDKQTDIGTHQAKFYNPLELNKRGLEFTINNVNNPVRVFFGSEKHFRYIVIYANSDRLEINCYESNNGVLTPISSVTNSLITRLNLSDVVRVLKQGENYVVYINDILGGSVNCINGSAINEPYFCGLMFRDKTGVNVYSDLKYIDNNNYLKAHISCDDFNSILKEVAESEITSIWENPIFAFMKSMNAKYGAVFSLYLFTRYPNFDISNFPSIYKNELSRASNWLKFGFHCREDLHYVNFTKDIVVQDYQECLNEIIRFAGEGSIDYMPRIHYYSLNRETVNELNSLGLIKGLLTADDTREINVGLNNLERNVVNNSDMYIDYERGLKFFNTSYRFDGDNPTTSESKIQATFQDINNKEIQILFFHEGHFKTYQSSIQKMIETLKNLDYKFEFPQNFNI